MDGRGEQPAVRLAVTPGNGWIARRDTALLFVPETDHGARNQQAPLLAAKFLEEGPNEEVRSTGLDRCIVEWSHADGAVRVDSTFAVVEERSSRNTPQSEVVRVGPGRVQVPRRPGLTQAIVSDTGRGGLDSCGDLRDGDAPAGGFVLVLPEIAPAEVTTVPSAPADITADPQFDELTDLDVTLTAVGPITYPDDDTDRTFRRSGDIRCPRGHANADSNHVCRVCGDALDSTAGRRTPRASTAVAGLRLPDGTVIAINRMIVVGRSPTPEGARLDVTPLLVAIDAPGTVSRTHVLVRLDDGTITVTDCGARGRTAVLALGRSTPIALEPWQPRAVSIGDTIQLGGPTTLTITDPAELRTPPALEPTAQPPERNQTT